MTTPTLTGLALDTFATPDTDPTYASHEFCRSPLHPGPCKGWKQAKAQGRDHTVTHDDLIPGPRRRPNTRSAEDEARTRQAAIDHARNRADVLAEIEERIIGGEGNPIVLQRAAEQVARRHGVDTDPVIAALLRQLNDPAEADDHIARAAAALGLDRIGGSRGQTVQQIRYNPAEHVSIGARPGAGATWIERSPTSTSADPIVARGFAVGAESVIMRVHVPAGVGAIQLSGWQSQHRRNAEAELALQPYLRFRVVGDNMGTISSSDRQLRILDVVVEELDDDE